MHNSSKLILGAALLCLAGVGTAQTTNPDRPGTTSDRPAATTPPASTTSPGTTSTAPGATSAPSSPSAATSPSMDTRTTTTETRTYRDPATGRMVNEPARMDTARAPRADRN